MLQRHQKLIRRLHQKRLRQKDGLMLVEGEKLVLELLDSDWQISLLFFAQAFAEKHTAKLEAFEGEMYEVEAKLLSKCGTLQTNEMALAIAAIPSASRMIDQSQPLILALDDIRDPGNLGAILRIADWYAVRDVLCSPTCVEAHNPKVVNASKGSIFRVQTHVADLREAIPKLKRPAYAAVMDGQSVYTLAAAAKSILIMGNESHGITYDVQDLAAVKLSIPRRGGAESLNVAAACAVICDNLLRPKQR